MGYVEDMQFDIPISDAIFPYYSVKLIVISIFLVVISATIVLFTCPKNCENETNGCT